MNIKQRIQALEAATFKGSCSFHGEQNLLWFSGECVVLYCGCAFGPHGKRLKWATTSKRFHQEHQTEKDHLCDLCPQQIARWNKEHQGWKRELDGTTLSTR